MTNLLDSIPGEGMDPGTAMLVGGAIQGVSSLIGGSMGKDAANEAARKNTALQREFYQNGIQWRVADAKKAGIHPIYALGASGASYTPSYGGDNSLGAGLADMGQSVGRAVAATQSKDERLFEQASRGFQLERAQLENELLRTQISSINKTNSPALPSPAAESFMPGQGDAPHKVNVTPVNIPASPNGAPQEMAGSHPYSWYTRSATGLKPVMPPELAESFESDPAGAALWILENRWAPNFGGGRVPDEKTRLKYGPYKHWGWSHLDQEWQPQAKPRLNLGDWFYDTLSRASGRY